MKILQIIILLVLVKVISAESILNKTLMFYQKGLSREKIIEAIRENPIETTSDQLVEIYSFVQKSAHKTDQLVKEKAEQLEEICHKTLKLRFLAETDEIDKGKVDLEKQKEVLFNNAYGNLRNCKSGGVFFVKLSQINPLLTTKSDLRARAERLLKPFALAKLNLQAKEDYLKSLKNSDLRSFLSNQVKGKILKINMFKELILPADKEYLYLGKVETAPFLKENLLFEKLPSIENSELYIYPDFAKSKYLSRYKISEKAREAYDKLQSEKSIEISKVSNILENIEMDLSLLQVENLSIEKVLKAKKEEIRRIVNEESKSPFYGNDLKHTVEEGVIGFKLIMDSLLKESIKVAESEYFLIKSEVSIKENPLVEISDLALKSVKELNEKVKSVSKLPGISKNLLHNPDLKFLDKKYRRIPDKLWLYLTPGKSENYNIILVSSYTIKEYF